MKILRVPFLLLAAWLPAALILGAQEPAATEAAAVRAPVSGSGTGVRTKSASGRFMVTGPDAAATDEYARWAEDQAARLERLLAAPLPPAGRAPVEIVVMSDKAAGPAVETRTAAGLPRALIVNEARRPDYDILQEGLCALLLDACVEERRRERGRPPGGAGVPQWFSMGVAQNLAAETRASNRTIMTGWTPLTERPPISTVWRWTRLPEGWPRNRALCGMAALWLGACKEGASAYAQVLDRLAEGAPVDAEWVAVRLVGVASAADLDRVWEDWLARQGRVVQEFGALSSALIEQLRAELDLVLPAAAGAAPAGAEPRRLAPSDVQALRNRSVFVRLLASEKVQRIRAVTLGKAPELVEAGEAYAGFYEGIAGGIWSVRTRFRLRRADAALQRLAALTRAREAYLDAVEREQAGTDAIVGDPDGEILEPLLEKGPIEVYLDDAEKRFQQTEEGQGTGRRP
jgi:hypothetical protein